MDTSRTTYISDFFYNNHTDDGINRDRFFYLKLHALFNCLTPYEIKTLYFNHARHSDKFKATLFNFIGRKSESQSLDFSIIAKDLIENYTYQPYNLQIASRTFLSKIIQHLEKDIIRDYFQLFIKSDRINDRKNAYEVSKYIWSEIEHIIWDNLYKINDKGALEQIVNNTDSSDLASQIENIWSIEYLDNRLKKQIIDKTCNEDIIYFEFLKETEPTYYIQALIVRNQTVDKKILNLITTKMKQEKNGFLFYYLGLAKDWNLLTDSLKTMKS